MSIRHVTKDHLQDHAGIECQIPGVLPVPDHEDPLKFWTHHPTAPTLIDLSIFAEGEREAPGNQRWSGPFSGRPALIHQLAPAIQAACIGLTKGSARSYTTSLRMWWRLLDAVENGAEALGQPMDRVEDVRSLTRTHCDFAHRSGMRKDVFGAFVRVANATLIALRMPILHWHAPDTPEPERHLPSEEQTKAIRIALKQAWDAVRRDWAAADRVRAGGFEPQTREDDKRLKHWQTLEKAQRIACKALPSASEIAEAHGYKSLASLTSSTGLTLRSMTTLAFPDREEVGAAFHLCLANTGWNPAVLYSLDASQPQLFLRSHPRDTARYLLVGTKAKAGGKEQIVSGLWKTPSSPGFILKAWLERTAPLREQLRGQLANEHTRYAELIREGRSADELATQLAKIYSLQEGCRSVWLYVQPQGDIGWFDGSTTNDYSLNGKKVTYLTVLLDRLNRERTARGEKPIPAVTASDFRDIFALYVWRISGGNILAVMRALNHAHLRTTERYTDNNILNAERDQQARTFLDHLFAELGEGRLDITILAHLQRYGAVTEKMEQRLSDYRRLHRSRMDVACTDPFHPPKDMQPESRHTRICSKQRCLLCKSHSVILPESLPGIAMRVEELETIRTSVPAGDWLKSQFHVELRNGVDVLKLFPEDAVRAARERWARAIADGSHHVPGLNLAGADRSLA